MDTINNLNTVSHYLARRDINELSGETIKEPIDILVLLGCSLIEPVHIAADAFKNGLVKRLLISGGIGHSTPDLYEAVATIPEYKNIPTTGRAEADIFFDILTQHLLVPADSIMVENKSTTCGFNAEESRKLLDAQDLDPGTMLLIQDPTMQQRSHACFVRNWRDKPDTRIISFAPFIPQIVSSDPFAVVGSDYNLWPFKRFISLVLGEIPRLRDDEQGYGPKGSNFIDHIDIPPATLAAYDEVSAQFTGLIRE